jgi:hypothetical protein
VRQEFGMAKKTTTPPSSITSEPTIAGSRLSLPGQHISREEWLRDELNKDLQPEGPIETRWVEDIAYRWVRIDLIRAQIAGLQNRLVQDQLNELIANKDVTKESLFPPPLSPREREVLDGCQSLRQRIDTDDILDNPDFAWLLGRLSSGEVQLLKSLQLLEHEEARERDRVVNQFERRRRLKAQHLIMLIDAKERGALPTVCDSPVLETVVIESEGNADAVVLGDGGA